MPIYQYSGRNAEGQIERGMMPANSIEAVTQRLQQKGLEIQELSVAEGGEDPLRQEAPKQYNDRSKFQTEIAGPMVGQVGLQHLHFFFRQLASMLSAGIGTSQALATLSTQTQSPKLGRILKETQERVTGGEPISAAFQRYPEVFSPMVMSLVRAGEEGGFLANQCNLISDYIKSDMDLRNLIKKETFYPKVVLVSSIFIILGARMVVASLGKETHLTSPLTEPGTWLIIAPVVVGLFVYFKVIKRQPQMQFGWDAFVLKIPFIGKTWHGFAMAKFGRCFGALYKGGVPLGKALKLSADACSNEYVRSRLYPAADSLDRGEGVTAALASTGVVSPIVLDMTKTGEMTGNLDEMLEKMCEYYEEEGAIKARQAAIILGVFILLATAAYVLYVVVTFYSGLGTQYQQQM